MHLNIPEGFTWPAPLKKLIAAHDKAWSAWADAEIVQLEAVENLALAAEQDKALLIEAVAAGAPDPGTPSEHAARRACIYAEEAARQAATKVNELVVQIRDTLPNHQAELITQACALEREAIAARVKLMAEAQEIANKANAVGCTIGTRANWLIDELALGATAMRVQPNTEEVSWLAPWQLQNLAAATAVDRLEGVDTGAPVSLRAHAAS